MRINIPYIYINIRWEYGESFEDFYTPKRCMEIRVQDVKCNNPDFLHLFPRYIGNFQVIFSFYRFHQISAESPLFLRNIVIFLIINYKPKFILWRSSLPLYIIIYLLFLILIFITH